MGVTPGFAGWYYWVSARDHVGYESWLERDRFDPAEVIQTDSPGCRYR